MRPARSHAQVIRDLGGEVWLSNHLDVPSSTVRSWADHDSIPLWIAWRFEDAGWATCRELSEYAFNRYQLSHRRRTQQRIARKK